LLVAVESVADDAPGLLVAVLSASTEKLRSFTEEQQNTINAMKTRLGITEQLLTAICTVALDNGVPLELLRDELTKIGSSLQRRA
jgi:hypothetical protein